MSIQVKEEMDSGSDGSVIVEDDEEEGELMAKPAGVTEQHLLSDIERLRIEKEHLKRRLQDQQQTKQDIEVWSQLRGLYIRYVI